MITKKLVNKELYVYYNNVLIYKRWLNHNYGRVFHENEGLTQFIK